VLIVFYLFLIWNDKIYRRHFQINNFTKNLGGLTPNIFLKVPTAGEQLQLLVKGGCWKTSILETGELGLISEA